MCSSLGRAITLLGMSMSIGTVSCLIVKWDLDHGQPMIGKAPRRVRILLEELEREGAL
jgi:hypothetical protein